MHLGLYEGEMLLIFFHHPVEKNIQDYKTSKHYAAKQIVKHSQSQII